MAWLGTPSLAFLVGVGAAVAVGGAVMGTLIPQTQASFNVFNPTSAGETWLARLFFGAIMLVGTITTLVYFHFGARSTAGGPQRGKLVEWLSLIGQVFIAITLGVLFAGVFAAALTALIERLNFIWYFLTSVL
jgi:heme/copper-type cytochrome/quinol oxidase subunit 2